MRAGRYACLREQVAQVNWLMSFAIGSELQEALTWVAQFQRQAFSRFPALVCHGI
jgi:hypothetical protein